MIDDEQHIRLVAPMHAVLSKKGRAFLGLRAQLPAHAAIDPVLTTMTTQCTSTAAAAAVMATPVAAARICACVRRVPVKRELG